VAVRTRRRAGRCVAGISATALAVLPVTVTPSGAAPTARAAATAKVALASEAADEGFRLETRTTYAFDAVSEVVHVAFDATITNQRPDQVSGGYVTQYFLPEYHLPVLAEAVNVTATEGGSALPVRLDGTESPRFKLAVVDLQPDLRYGQTQQVHVTYDLPKVPPRSDGLTRLNKAYATFPAIALGDPGLTSVEILMPRGWEVDLVGSEMEESTRDGRQLFTAEDIQDPSSWEVLVSARDDRNLLERKVDIGDDEVRVLAWPDDPAWADFAEEQVADGIPVLEDLIGIDWPAEDTIEVVETASPYLYGYAGWYMPYESVIEVGDELEQQVMLHELSHLWFNDDLFVGRWINEAFAECLSALAIGELGGKAPEPKPIRADDPGTVTLNDWSNPNLQEGASDAQERFGYNASWAVMDAIVDEVGADAIADVIQAADEGEIAYRGPGVPEELARRFDWRELLDLLEEVGGSKQAAGLFERHVVAPSEVELFELRAAARLRYAALVEEGDGWAAPTAIRLAMADWRFPAAEELMDDALAILEQKAELLALVADLDVAEELALQRTYEAGEDLGDVARDAADAIDAAEAVGAAEDEVEDGAGPIGALGLAFAGAGDELADAQRAFEAGDYHAARSAALAAEEVVDEAVLTAVMRLVGLIALVAVALLLREGLRRYRTRRAEREARAEAAAAAASAEAAPWGPEASEADGAEGVGGAVDDGSEVGVGGLEP
jgi:hypothetical protein